MKYYNHKILSLSQIYPKICIIYIYIYIEKEFIASLSALFYENRADQSYKIESMKRFKTLPLQWLALVSERVVSLFYVLIYIFIEAHKHHCCSVFMANLGCKCVRACARGRVCVFSWRACLSGLIPALSRQLTYLATTLPKGSNVQLDCGHLHLLL